MTTKVRPNFTDTIGKPRPITNDMREESVIQVR
jgi:hypothetical protein